MKKFMVSLILVIFTFSAFYPVIYATEELITNEPENKNVVQKEREENDQLLELKEELEEEQPKQENMIQEPEVIFNEIQENVVENSNNTTNEIENSPIIDELAPEGEPETELKTKSEIQLQSEINLLATYSGTMYIDTPTENQTCVLPDSDLLKVTGWAVSNDRNAFFKLYINDWLWAEIYERAERGDESQITANYGGTATTPQAGFSKDLDISGLGAGDYTIRIDQVSHDGQVICSASRRIHIKQEEFRGNLCFDKPVANATYRLPDTSTININGWAVSNDKNAYILISVDGKMAEYTLERMKREDADALISPAYGGTENTPLAGVSANLDISKLSEGSHIIDIMEVSRFHEIICRTQIPIHIEFADYEGNMCFDKPAINATYRLPDIETININGWAVSNDKNAYMLISVDGKMAEYTLERTKREDADALISPAYGGTENTPLAGVSVNLDISKLFEGSHIIDIMEVSRFHKIICRTQIPINISTPDYAGNMNLEEPVQNKRYRSGWLEVKGWAITESQNDFLEIYLDGNYIIRPERTQRPDVVGVYQGQYGVNANSIPGFYSQINTSHLGEGTHTLKVVHYSGYGKKIQEREVRFVISNTTTWGIDASHYQNNVDWNAVRNSGVNFAILKIGEYSETKGIFYPDARFNEYYVACKQYGIAVGGYIYSYEFNPEEAKHEAEACLQYISGKSFEMPIFLDIEDDRIANAITKGETSVDAVTNGAVTFCRMMNEHGYQAGVYANKTFFSIYLNASVLEQYNIWLAHYTNAPASNYPGRHDIWQYTDSGTVPGINGPVDLNWCFKRYY